MDKRKLPKSIQSLQVISGLLMFLAIPLSRVNLTISAGVLIFGIVLVSFEKS